MKEMYVIVIVSLTSLVDVNAQKPPCPLTKCPPQEKYASNLPHETDCTKFYKCNWGTPVLQDCPLMIPNDPNKRLHYNRRLQVCDWPAAAGCESCPPKDDCPPPKISNPKNNCKEYYQCNGETKVNQTCPDDTCFSRTCQACVPNRAGGNCDDDKEPTTRNPILCTPGERKPHECNCTLYYVCNDDEEWVREECEGGLHFNPKSEKCEEPDKAGCQKLLLQ